MIRTTVTPFVRGACGVASVDIYQRQYWPLTPSPRALEDCTADPSHKMLACIVGRARVPSARVPSARVPSAGLSCGPPRPCAQQLRLRHAGLLRAAAGHPGQDDRRTTVHQSASYASYSGRGKPTRTRVRQQAPTEQEEAARYSEIAKRHDESVAQSQTSETAATTTRQVDSLHDAGLKNFMVNIYTTTGGCIGMAAVGSVLPILGVVPMVHPLIPAIPFLVSQNSRSLARQLASQPASQPA